MDSDGVSITFYVFEVAVLSLSGLIAYIVVGTLWNILCLPFKRKRRTYSAATELMLKKDNR